MAIQIGGKSFETVSIIDDEPDFRNELETVISDGRMTPIPLIQPVINLEAFLNSEISNVDAVVTDHHLKKKANYFPINGAELSAIFYKKRKPSILVTKVEQPDLEIRRYRQYIPVVLNPADFDVDPFMRGIELCLEEFDNKFRPARRLWRTLVVVEEIEPHEVYVSVPSWSSSEKIRIGRCDFEEYPHVRDVLSPDKRLHAQVNVGAESLDELYFSNWETE